MRRISFALAVLVLLILSVLGTAGPAFADVQTGVQIDSSTGSFTVPGTCGIKPSGGGCSTPQKTFYVVSGIPYGSSCVGASVYLTGNGATGPCRIDNNAAASGTGSATVTNSSCGNFYVDLYIDALNPATIYFTDPGLVAWQVNYLHLVGYNGQAVPGGGWTWQMAGGFRGTNITNNNSTLVVQIQSGTITSNVNCSTVQSIYNLSFQFAGSGTILT
jgi:hypothetical protein